MPAAKNRRWIWAVLFVVLFPLFATHFSCIAVLGPGTWGSGLDEKLPTIMPANSNSRVAGYVREFADHPRKAASQVEAPPGASPFPGRAVYSDSIAPENLWVVQTHEGERWIDEQRVFVLRGGGAERQEVRIPEAMLVENPVFLRRRGRVVLVFGRWHSWHLSMGGKLARYWDSLFDETLRPEYSLYLYDLDEKQSTYWGPGHTLVASPDRHRALLLRSGPWAVATTAFTSTRTSWRRLFLFANRTPARVDRLTIAGRKIHERFDSPAAPGVSCAGNGKAGT